MTDRRTQPATRLRHRVASLPLLLLLVSLAGCQKPMRTPTAAISTGDYAAARLAVRSELEGNRNDRRYLLDRMRLGVLTLADGYPDAARNVFEEVYEVLRAQGINRDRTVQSVVISEDVRIWKGEPFEQALAMAYYAMTMASLDVWDNTRAAADNALFYLKDFGADRHGRRLNTHEIAQRSLLYERAIAQGAAADEARRRAEGRGEDFIDHGYVATRSDFTLGYLLAGVANQQLGRDEEASDHYNQVLRIDPNLRPLVDVLREGSYNTLLVVGWGLGPRKEGYGPDNALARFMPRFPSDRLNLRASVGVAGEDVTGWRSYPQVLDVNRMAADHMWNNMEDVRRAKSTVGTGLLYGGLMATAIGADVRSREAMYAGLGAMAAGAFLKAGAHVDTRYADVYPQRFYFIPLDLPDEPVTMHLQVEGYPASRIALAGLRAPRGPDAQLRYVRLVSPPPYTRQPAPAWANSGQIYYGNDRTGPTPASRSPLILGGYDARRPSERALDDYQAAGLLLDMTLSDLRELHRLEGLQMTVEDQGGYVDAHVLEGGRSMVPPLEGTVGFTRLFGQRREMYRPRSPQVSQLQRTLADPELQPVARSPHPAHPVGDTP
jgi:tetratricopeptide (TPR) repeat protein